jgi:DNA-binding response OmpR family regulator
MAQKILIVEDDSFLQGLAAGKLTKSGFDVHTAGNIAEAEKTLEEIVPDLIILDLVLPGGTDGFGILKKLRENAKTKETPVIIFSNLAEEADMNKAKELGANEFMVKSNFTLDELVTKIQELLK